MISLHSYLVYTYEQHIFIDEIQVYSRRHIQLSSTHAHSGGQLNIFCFALFHWSERFSELFYDLYIRWWIHSDDVVMFVLHFIACYAEHGFYMVFMSIDLVLLHAMQNPCFIWCSCLSI